MARNGSGVTFNLRNWDKVVEQIIDGDGVDRMKRVADAANNGLENTDGYRVSTEGKDPLSKRDYTATVITATAEAMRDNASNNTLIQNLHRAGGA